MRHHYFQGCGYDDYNYGYGYGFGAGPETPIVPPTPVPTTPLVIPPAMATPIAPMPIVPPVTPSIASPTEVKPPTSVVSHTPTPQLTTSPIHPIPGVHHGMHHGVICVPAVFFELGPKA